MKSRLAQFVGELEDRARRRSADAMKRDHLWRPVASAALRARAVSCERQPAQSPAEDHQATNKFALPL